MVLEILLLLVRRPSMALGEHGIPDIQDLPNNNFQTKPLNFMHEAHEIQQDTMADGGHCIYSEAYACAVAVAPECKPQDRTGGR